jgi:FeS assembly protein IscX
MKWTDVNDIAIELEEKFPDQDLLKINFVWLRDQVIELADFDDDPHRSSERVLEAIQQAWMDERC